MIYRARLVYGIAQEPTQKNGIENDKMSSKLPEKREERISTLPNDHPSQHQPQPQHSNNAGTPHTICSLPPIGLHGGPGWRCCSSRDRRRRVTRLGRCKLLRNVCPEIRDLKIGIVVCTPWPDDIVYLYIVGR